MKLLEALYRISSPSGMEAGMIGFITRRLREMDVDYSIDQLGNIYATKGDADTYPCIVAHADEVHPPHGKGFELMNLGSIIFGYDRIGKTFAGIGADDKNGIWICLKCLEEFDALKCAFFVGEEYGCVGSGSAHMPFFDDCRFVLQCDHKGNGDLITSINGQRLCSEEFIRAVDPARYGYTPTQGMTTDIFALKCNGLKVSCANISCGYYDPHTDHEHTDLRDLRKSLRFVRHIIADCREVYAHRHTPLGYGGWRWFGVYDDSPMRHL